MDATRVVLRSGPEATIGECLLATTSLAGLTEPELRRRAAAGEIVDAVGTPVGVDDPATLNTSVYLYRDLPDEVPIPFDLPILYLDENIVVVDKPHFLATMPRGRHVTQTALVRLRRQLGTDLVAPAHRLDRLTAGVLLFTLRPPVRAAYQQLFADRLVTKEYLALAPADDRLRAGITVRDRIEKTAGDLRARVVDGPVNAISDIELLGDIQQPGDIDQPGDIQQPGDIEQPRKAGIRGGRYRLVPHTGRTHQLRLHMASLGVPIVGDPLYPDIRADLAELPDQGDFGQPLRLIAHTLAFTDPLSGEPRHFESRRGLT